MAKLIVWLDVHRAHGSIITAFVIPSFFVRWLRFQAVITQCHDCHAGVLALQPSFALTRYHTTTRHII